MYLVSRYKSGANEPLGLLTLSGDALRFQFQAVVRLDCLEGHRVKRSSLINEGQEYAGEVCKEQKVRTSTDECQSVVLNLG